MKKTAVILFNLGGPDSLQAVRPFLFNLFNDPAIIRLPPPLRQFVAWMISSRREETAQDIYKKMGGRSPILPNTEAQAAALEALLNNSAAVAVVSDALASVTEQSRPNFKCFIAMRYWHPFAEETAKLVKAYAPDEIILLPLYPQFSTTTSGSSLKQWREVSLKAGLGDIPAKATCCYPAEQGFVAALAEATKGAYSEAAKFGKPRILFSAHGLPEKIVLAGDPYQYQCEQTVKALVAKLGIDGLDYVSCYQSRVGPLKWIGPATDDEVKRAGANKVPVVMVPIAFVSEHSETLVELGMEYRHLAGEVGVPHYTCVPTVSVSPVFIEGLAGLVTGTMQSTSACAPCAGQAKCPDNFSGCACR